MRFLAALGVAVMVGAAAPPVTFHTAIVEYGSEVGAAAYFFGSCEHFADKRQADAMAADLTGADVGGPAQEIAAVFARMYGKGRKDAAKNAYSAEQCQRLLDESGRAVGEAKQRVEMLRSR